MARASLFFRAVFATTSVFSLLRISGFFGGLSFGGFLKSTKSHEKMAAAAKPDSCVSVKDVMAVLECTVCLEDIKEPPIYVCENPQGHLFCTKCHQTLKNERKPCPTCQQPLADMRSLADVDYLLDLLLQQCKFEGCSFKASTLAAMAKHAEDWHRLIPCAWCDRKIGVKGLGDHLEKKHGNRQFTYEGLSEVQEHCIDKTYMKGQALLVFEGGNGPQFMFNWVTICEGAKMVLISHLGPKEEAKRFKYNDSTDSN